jgi:hypothetical protein
MNYKTHIKLGNKTINISKIDYMDFNQEKLMVTVNINFEVMKFKFSKEESYNRFLSFIKLYSTEFDCDVEKIDEVVTKEKEILKG